MIKQALAKLGHHWHPMFLSTGQQALDLIVDGQERWVDLVLVNLDLPHMNGVEVIRQANKRWPHAPVLVCSTHCRDNVLLAAIRAGAHGFVDKSDLSMTMSQAIDSVLKGEYPISASLAKCLFRLVPRAEVSQPESRIQASEASLLSPRELELLRHLSDGHSYAKASQRMGVSLNTAQTFSRRIFQKLEVNTKVQAIKAAQTLGLI